MYGDKGSPCDKPLDGTICPLGSPFIIIEKEIVLTHSIGLFLKKKKKKRKRKKKRKEKKRKTSIGLDSCFQKKNSC